MGQRLVYCAVRVGIALIGYLPFPVLYGLSNVLYGVVYRLLGYRKAVVRDNLRQAFPHKTAAERLVIEQRFYHFLFDVLLESLKGFSLSAKALQQRQRHTTPEFPQSLVDQGRSCIIVGGHYGNWEWAALCAAFQATAPIAVLYEPLHNPYLDRYIRQQRERWNTQLYSGRQALRVFSDKAQSTTVFVLIADQSPSNPGRAYWLPFLHRDTPVLRGPAIYAHRYNLPFLFLKVQRIRRGHYEMGVEVLTESPKDYSPEALIQLYWDRLEAQIEAEPALWLWSHRRWKHQR